MKKAVFLDRDGVINRKAPEGHYVTRWEEMEFLPGVADAIGRLNHADYLVIIVSNQRCVAKGLITTDELESLHERMRHELEAAGARIDAIYYCPHDYQPACACRKPHPGMLLDAARAFAVNLDESWMIGDSAHDIEAGKKAGCKTVRLTESGRVTEGDPTVVASSLLEAVPKILEPEQVSLKRG